MLVRSPGFARARAAWCIAAMTLSACKGGEKMITPPNTAKPCGSGGTVQLSTLQAATISCSAGTTVTLPGGGASYLVVPQYATGNAVNRAVSYTLGIAGGATASIVEASGPSLAVVPQLGGTVLPSSVALRSRQRAFDAALMDQAREKVARGAWHRVTPAAPPARATVPALGSVQRFHVLSSENPVRFTAVGASLSYIGSDILIYIDTLAPANGFTPSQLQSFGQLFDQILYPLDTNTFGPPTDIDQNGHLIVLLSPIVNALTPASSCNTEGFIGGFFDGIDLASTATSSNRGENCTEAELHWRNPAAAATYGLARCQAGQPRVRGYRGNPPRCEAPSAQQGCCRGTASILRTPRANLLSSAWRNPPWRVRRVVGIFRSMNEQIHEEAGRNEFSGGHY